MSLSLHEKLALLERKLQDFSKNATSPLEGPPLLASTSSSNLAFRGHEVLQVDGEARIRCNSSENKSDQCPSKKLLLLFENELAARPTVLLNLNNRKRREICGSRGDSQPKAFQQQQVEPPPPHSGKHNEHTEEEKRLHEIMRQTGILRFSDAEYKSDPADLVLISSLGHGTCGHVVKMLHPPTGCVMAVKQMRRSGNKEENKRVITDLDVVLKSHDCPYIVRCFGCFITDSDVWICMELMATCLDKLSKRLGTGIPERILGKITVSVVHALDYLKEKQGIMHRDVKPSNILLDSNGTVKLCDFGICGRLVDSRVRSRTAGCVAYMAPERIEPINFDYDIRADVWSLGISLIELATGKFPYGNCKTDFELLAKIVQDEPPILTPYQGFSAEFCTFAVNCLSKNVHDRPKYKELLKFEFVKFYEANQVDVGTWFNQITQRKNAVID